MSAAFTIRPGAGDERAACVDLWALACAARDGRRTAGVAERAEAKFETAALWLVADHDGRIDGFALATVPGSGAAGDPANAAVLGLLAVAPQAQGAGLGRQLLRAASDGLATLGYPRAVLHVLQDNEAAVRLYESEGWRPLGAPFEHSLLHRPTQSYAISL